MVDVTVLEQAPELQACQQGSVIWGAGMAKSAVKTVDGPQLCAAHHHRKLHLLHMSIRIQVEHKDVGKSFYSEAGPHLCALGVTLSLRDYI